MLGCEFAVSSSTVALPIAEPLGLESCGRDTWKSQSGLRFDPHNRVGIKVPSGSVLSKATVLLPAGWSFCQLARALCCNTHGKWLHWESLI